MQGKKVYVISAWATQGIREGEMLNLGRVFVDSTGTWPSFEMFVSHEDYRDTREAAVVRCEEMRKNKIKWLKASIAKLEALEFK